MSDQLHGIVGTLVVVDWVILLVAGERFVAIRSGKFSAFEDLGIGITESDSDIADPFLSESDSGDSRDCPYDGGLAVCDMSDCADVDGSLSADDLW